MAIDIELWLNLIVRWAHIIVGIGWIGASFYFVALDLALRAPANSTSGVRGEAWQVHGGGFYHVQKYMNAPDSLPEKLIWYKWDAYLTWITGFLLLIIQYYLKADIYLIDPDVKELSSQAAILLSILSLALGWFVYDFLCRALKNQTPLFTAVPVFVLIVVASYGFTTIYSGRGALIHVGAFIGTIMAANVFGIIIPNQKKIVRDLLDHKEPDASLGKMSKQRSMHNNYLTLPVLLLMVSNHYPILTSHQHGWLIVALILIVGASVRHVINRHEAGEHFQKFWWALPSAGISLLAIIIMTAPAAPSAPDLQARSNQSNIPITDAAAFKIVQTHCGACHAPVEGYEEDFVAPKNIRLSTIADIKRYKEQIKQQTVTTKAMPMGNATQMTQEERALLGLWIDQNKR